MRAEPSPASYWNGSIATRRKGCFGSFLRVASTTGPGVLSDATYVQRLNTAGGKAPASGCDATTAGTDTRSAYSADYYFYVSINQLDGGADH